MSETIPAEYRALADAVVDRGFDEGLIDAIAQAILSAEKRGAERERAGDTLTGFGSGVRVAASSIASTIRGTE